MKPLRSTLIAIGTILIVFFLSHPFLPAQAQISAESRINRLESDLRTLQNQLNQSPRTRPAPGVNVPSPVPLNLPQQVIVSSDPRFDQLATLVIELRERINTLEQRINRLERPSR